MEGMDDDKVNCYSKAFKDACGTDLTPCLECAEEIYYRYKLYGDWGFD